MIGTSDGEVFKDEFEYRLNSIPGIHDVLKSFNPDIQQPTEKLPEIKPQEPLNELFDNLTKKEPFVPQELPEVKHPSFNPQLIRPEPVYNDTPSDKQRSDDFENGKWFMSGRDSLKYLLKDAPDSPAISTEEFMRLHDLRDTEAGRKIGLDRVLPHANDNKNLQIDTDPYTQGVIDNQWNSMVKRGNQPNLKIVPTKPAPGSSQVEGTTQVADTGGGSVPPLEIENALTLHAMGKLTNAQARKALPAGWTIDFRNSKSDAYRLYAPDGKEHYIWP